MGMETMDQLQYLSCYQLSSKSILIEVSNALINLDLCCIILARLSYLFLLKSPIQIVRSLELFRKDFFLRLKKVFK